jgi:hypothetical protein
LDVNPKRVIFHKVAIHIVGIPSDVFDGTKMSNYAGRAISKGDLAVTLGGMGK